MRVVRPLILSAAALAIAGVAYAERPVTHVAAYALPDGGVAQVRYTGDVAPQLVVVGDPEGGAMSSPFAAFDRIAAMMDAQADAMLADVAGMQQAVASLPTFAGPAPATIALVGAPAGARSTSVSRTVSGGKVCTTEVSTVSQGEGKAPSVVRKVSGDCAGMPTVPATPTPPTAPTVPRDSI